MNTHIVSYCIIDRENYFLNTKILRFMCHFFLSLVFVCNKRIFQSRSCFFNHRVRKVLVKYIEITFLYAHNMVDRDQSMSSVKIFQKN